MGESYEEGAGEEQMQISTWALQYVAPPGLFAGTTNNQTQLEFQRRDITLTASGLSATVSPMQKINSNELKEESWSSPKGKFVGFGKEVSEALGREPNSTDLMKRHPFDVEIVRIPPGKAPYPFHLHSAQWEFYHVISGTGTARDASGTTPIGPGDAFLFKPNEPHQILNTGEVDLVMYVVADNPIGESAYYPDSKKWLVRSPERAVLRGGVLDYFEGEE